MAAHLLLIGNIAGSGCANLHQCLLHLEDDHADHLGRIFRLIEQVCDIGGDDVAGAGRSEEHTSELQSLMRISYAVFCLKKKIKSKIQSYTLMMMHLDRLIKLT